MTSSNAISQVNLKVNTQLKENAYATLKELGTTPSDFFRDILEYVVREKKLPIKRLTVSDEDAEFYALVRERLKNPDKIHRNVDLESLLR
ncbi:type II toxin-antitoxin system RelB/DinJ family antitoxin [Acetobacter pasteurianus]|uniref:type II toxin-antitoxin system RelB/DinJ family antitoxin n=1 Tax=Acetobacter pasteurianus TaxID=438 RepID=UPI000F56F994|nr:type II toxin-antitoxin system RelB/DinJ family antitoxin [Acetobacter pasteurianus]GCD57145.1 bifunctional antitoxin/transcriptional repressor RelB [Acetobacter pasteurianus NBRC 3222]